MARFSFPAADFDVDHRDVAAQKRLLRERMTGFGWLTPRILTHQAAGDVVRPTRTRPYGPGKRNNQQQRMLRTPDDRGATTPRHPSGRTFQGAVGPPGQTPGHQVPVIS
jgi:hypothetical protein